MAQNDARAADILGRKASGLLAHDDTLVELADADCEAALVSVIAERTHLRQELVTRAIGADSDETISVMCRAAGFKLNSYSALLRMRRRRNLEHGSAPTNALTFFSSLTRASAERQLPRLAASMAEPRGLRR